MKMAMTPKERTKKVMEEMRKQGIEEVWLYSQMSMEKLERVNRELLKSK